MSSATFWPEAFTEQRPTRSSMIASGVLHALLMMWILFMPRPAPPITPMTEITLLDPGDLAAAPAPAAAAAPAQALEAVPGMAAASVSEQRFRREARTAEVAPDPQRDAALDDRLNARLAAMQSRASAPSIGSAPEAPPSMLAAAPAVTGATGRGGPPLALTRGGTGGAPVMTLARGAGAGAAPALATGPGADDREAAAPARGGDAAARRTLAGATLMGPIADRPVTNHVAPIYPEWAKGEGVEGSVTLYFVVRPDGSIRENVLVQKTAGFEEFDENARAALRAWRFEALRDGRIGDQWGTITFHFRLRDSG